MSRRLWVFPGSMSFQWWRCWAFGFPRVCLPINSILCPLLLFFLLRFFWDYFLLQPCAYLRFFWVKLPEFPDGDLLHFDGICLAVLQSLLFSYIRYVFFVPCSFVFCALVFVGLFGRVLFVTGCFKGFRCPPVFLWVWGFLVGVESRISEWVHWWCKVFWVLLSFRVCGVGWLCFDCCTSCM